MAYVVKGNEVRTHDGKPLGSGYTTHKEATRAAKEAAAKTGPSVAIKDTPFSRETFKSLEKTAEPAAGAKTEARPEPEVKAEAKPHRKTAGAAAEKE